MRHVLVTGASGGIGAATARAFAVEGWFVHAVDRAPAPEGLPAETFLQVDLSDPASPASVLAHLGQRPLHALVNNAAIGHNTQISNTTWEALDAVLATNLRTPFHLTRVLLPHLQMTSGAIVNVASVHAMGTSANAAAYAASKGGLVSFTRAAAVEFAGDAVRCNAVLPGATDTPMLENGLSRQRENRQHDDSRRRLESRTPLGRIGRPDEIAQAILFLADSDRSGFITGQTLVVDGGVLARLASE